MSYFRWLLKTDGSWAPLALRVGLAAVMFPHGAQKVMGWFGGYGFAGTMNYFTQNMGIPWIFAFAAIVTEFAGSMALLTGLATRLQALLIGIVMVVAMLSSHIQHGFFMNWFGQQQGEGIEYFILAISMAAALVLTGGGKASVDRFIQRKILGD